VPTNKQADAYNDMVLDLFEGEERFLFAADSLKEADDADAIPPGLHWIMFYDRHHQVFQHISCELKSVVSID